MSDYRFGTDDYKLNIYPKEAFDGCGGFDIDKVERIEIEWVDFYRERECEMTVLERYDGMDPHYRCSACSYENYEYDMPRFCPNCGASVKAVKR